MRIQHSSAPAETMLAPSSVEGERGPSSPAEPPSSIQCSRAPRVGSSRLQYNAANGMSLASDAPKPAASVPLIL